MAKVNTSLSSGSGTRLYSYRLDCDSSAMIEITQEGGADWLKNLEYTALDGGQDGELTFDYLENTSDKSRSCLIKINVSGIEKPFSCDLISVTQLGKETSCSCSDIKAIDITGELKYETTTLTSDLQVGTITFKSDECADYDAVTFNVTPNGAASAFTLKANNGIVYIPKGQTIQKPMDVEGASYNVTVLYNNVPCSNITIKAIEQDGAIPCSCEGMNRFVVEREQEVSMDGSGGMYVYVGSGNTGIYDANNNLARVCGSLSATSTSDMFLPLIGEPATSRRRVFVEASKDAGSTFSDNNRFVFKAAITKGSATETGSIDLYFLKKGGSDYVQCGDGEVIRVTRTGLSECCQYIVDEINNTNQSMIHPIDDIGCDGVEGAKNIIEIRKLQISEKQFFYFGEPTNVSGIRGGSIGFSHRTFSDEPGLYRCYVRASNGILENPNKGNRIIFEIPYSAVCNADFTSGKEFDQDGYVVGSGTICKSGTIQVIQKGCDECNCESLDSYFGDSYTCAFTSTNNNNGSTTDFITSPFPQDLLENCYKFKITDIDNKPLHSGYLSDGLEFRYSNDSDGEFIKFTVAKEQIASTNKYRWKITATLLKDMHGGFNIDGKPNFKIYPYYTEEDGTVTPCESAAASITLVISKSYECPDSCSKLPKLSIPTNAQKYASYDSADENKINVVIPHESGIEITDFLIYNILNDLTNGCLAISTESVGTYDYANIELGGIANLKLTLGEIGESFTESSPRTSQFKVGYILNGDTEPCRTFTISITEYFEPPCEDACKRFNDGNKLDGVWSWTETFRFADVKREAISDTDSRMAVKVKPSAASKTITIGKMSGGFGIWNNCMGIRAHSTASQINTAITVDDSTNEVKIKLPSITVTEQTSYQVDVYLLRGGKDNMSQTVTSGEFEWWGNIGNTLTQCEMVSTTIIYTDKFNGE